MRTAKSVLRRPVPRHRLLPHQVVKSLSYRLSGNCINRTISAIPLLRGLHTGVVSDLSPMPVANARVSCAITPQPLSPSHSIDDGAALDLTESTLHRRKHHVTNIVTRITTGCCHLTHRFTVAAVQGKRHPQWLAVLAPEFEAIGVPSLIVPGDRHPTIATARDGRPLWLALQRRPTGSKT